MLVNFVKEGAGTTNTGGCARTGFQNAETAAEILGLPLEIVKGICGLWLALRASFRIPADSFKAFAEDFRAMYKRLLPGAEMPPTLHKVIAHGHRFFECVPWNMVMAMFSEEPLEASHKTLRHDELHNSRQTSRHDRIYDVFERQQVRGDPILLGPDLERHRNHTKDPYPREILDLASSLDPASNGEPMDTN